MLTSEQVARLSVEVSLGIPPEESRLPDTEETRRLRAEMLGEARLNPTVMWDVPFEWPDVEIAAIGTPEDEE